MLDHMWLALMEHHVLAMRCNALTGLQGRPVWACIALTVTAKHTGFVVRAIAAMNPPFSG